ncbi:hypothetical protein M407DRAFT_22382 [Tulasnella calospora MUT 4182]|uniref:Uncharacterized protein n=1 Tax=Tulasnella calospora MUT 4182 TaxID=1051891 RepID=A0A0C3M496_9AGAM|nr:hypothetical protein M407DRAFT_22382 [Tulasnella calospora MUT 4182]
MVYVTTDSSLRISAPKFLTCPTKEQVCGTSEDGLSAPDHDTSSGDLVGFSVEHFVNGPPAKTLKENLRNDTKYITTFLDAGWTNDVMTVVNLIYLGMVASRVPVLPPFSPMHVGYEAENFHFADIFDLPRLRAAIGYPIIEWHDLKDPTGNTQDVLGCWSCWALDHGNARGSRLSTPLDISYTVVPPSARLLNLHTSYWGLAKLGFPDGREEALRDAKPSPSSQHRRELLPDDHITCFDTVYFVSALDPFEWEKDHSPSWRFVGRHARFHPNMIKLAEQYLRKAFSLTEGEEIPKFISMHIRHGDFRDYCGDAPKEHCMAPVSVIAEAVDEVRASLKSRLGISVSSTEVLVTSDEQDPAWWAQIDERGWAHIDHKAEQTVEKLGRWYPTFIDGMHQSMGIGFVGTEGSTMSLLALKRVMDWNGGLGVMVGWGSSQRCNR